MTTDEHEAAVKRANAALETYTLSGDGWRRSPGETLQHVLADLLHWCDDTQRDFDAALERARARYAGEGPPSR
ncbi:hypothetical protein ACWIG3_26885 [Streptomyces celluloflavus]|uniref:Uncharacterized protein n=1 Tax=Streptomyces kasugaensis TaxID=1946 RepID=A0A4Q9I2B3_STRKA|nr:MULTISPECIES: hypothetical protein [Streptomyces]MYU51831.1 hypothetical protein [Streptomyces sp. SID7805]TBO60810.1 hypothetical protein EYS09_04360 [Streptomyces kasugaensis]